MRASEESLEAYLFDLQNLWPSRLVHQSCFHLVTGQRLRLQIWSCRSDRSHVSIVWDFCTKASSKSWLQDF